MLCQVLGPFAWSMGNKALREIDASNGQLGGRDTVERRPHPRESSATAILVLGIVVVLFFIVLGIYSASA